ncbi:MAG: dephospho-CoA kinase [Euzebya sp.]
MLLVGLTGGIASGKSTVSERFATVHGFPVVDADLIARQIVQPGQAALSDIVQRFGDDMLDADGRLDRAKLAAVVFGDDAERLALNAITHPRIAQAMAQQIVEYAGVLGPVIVDSPLLVEMGHAAHFPEIVVVTSSPGVQHQRLVMDRGMDPTQAWARINSQAPLTEKLAVATHVIDNDGSLAELHTRVDQVADELRMSAAEEPVSPT